MIRKFKKRVFAAVFLLLAIATITACSKSNLQVISNLNVRLTSLPFNNDLSVDIAQVQVTYDNDTTWKNLLTLANNYSLQQFVNKTDTLIAAGPVPATSIIRQLKIVFGNNSTITQGGKQVALPVLPGRQSVILTVNKKMNRFNELVTLEFNPAVSITYGGDGHPIYYPVVTIK